MCEAPAAAAGKDGADLNSDAPSSGESPSAVGTNSLNSKNCLPSLKYSFPPEPPRRGLKARPMTADQKATNAVFLRRLKQAWVEANSGVRQALAAAAETSETAYRMKQAGSTAAAAAASASAQVILCFVLMCTL
jgi:hypothetical protein